MSDQAALTINLNFRGLPRDREILKRAAAARGTDQSGLIRQFIRSLEVEHDRAQSQKSA